ncbi:MAG: response regulator, partial [Gemmatimonadota bacterium]|nr:response regulator [Gemmatimonadota bacterium]
DVSLPLLDGWEATRRLRADADTSDIPILALTACALPADRTMAMELGCDGYLAKPIEPRLVVAEVQRLLRERSGRCARSVAVESAA